MQQSREDYSDIIVRIACNCLNCTNMNTCIDIFLFDVIKSYHISLFNVINSYPICSSSSWSICIINMRPLKRLREHDSQSVTKSTKRINDKGWWLASQELVATKEGQLQS